MPARALRRAPALLAALCILVVGPGASAHVPPSQATPPPTTVRFTLPQLLRHLFARSERVAQREVQLTDTQRERWARRSLSTPPRSVLTLFVGTTGANVDGFVLLEDVKTPHGRVRVALLISPAGVLQQLEVVQHADAHGALLASEAFRRQFEGATHEAPLRVGMHLTVPADAQPAARALARAVHEALVLFDTLRLQEGTAASGAPAAGPTPARPL